MKVHQKKPVYLTKKNKKKQKTKTKPRYLITRRHKERYGFQL